MREGGDVKRRLLIVAIFLLAGAVVNVAVAWGCAACSKPTGVVRWSTSTGKRDHLWDDHRPSHFPDIPQYKSLDHQDSFDFGRRRSSVSVNQVHGMVVLDAGWPCYAVRGFLWGWQTEPGIVGQSISHSFWLPKGSVFEKWLTSRHIPLKPIWPGFVANTIFYAAFLWLLLPGPFALRRFIRVMRGLCPTCAYDLRHGEHDACPECGRLPSAR